MDATNKENSKHIAQFLLTREIPGYHIVHLDLSSTQLTTLPQSENYWKSFFNLTELNLSDNLLCNVPVEILMAPKLNNVILYGNPLDGIPDYLLNSAGQCSWIPVRNYLQTLQKDAIGWNERKLFIIGSNPSIGSFVFLPSSFFPCVSPFSFHTRLVSSLQPHFLSFSISISYFSPLFPFLP